jgi:endonuclease/exonuclease/phosphatase family metal-dependent hydrolase
MMGSIPEVPLARRREILTLPPEPETHAALLAGLGFDAALEVEPAPQPLAGPELRVVAWNAQRCRDPEAGAALLAATQAHVFLLSELDHGMARSDQRLGARELAARLGAAAFGVEFLELGLVDAAERAADAGAENAVGFHGGAILARGAFSAPLLVRLERGGRWFDGARGERRVGGRVAVLCRVALAGRELALASVHLESHSDPGERAEQLAAVVDALAAYAPGLPALVGGDVNPHSLGRAELETGALRRARGTPSRSPTRSRTTLFALAERRGFDWRACSAVGTRLTGRITAGARRWRSTGSSRAASRRARRAWCPRRASPITTRSRSASAPRDAARYTAPMHVDLLDPRTFESGVPHEFFAWLREHAPAYWHPGRPGRELFPGRVEPEQRGFWVISRHEDVAFVSKNQELFSSARGSALNADMPEGDLVMFQQQLIHMDPPRHTKLRNLVNRGFTPRMIGRLEPKLRELAREIVDKVAPKGECDFVTAIAAGCRCS